MIPSALYVQSGSYSNYVLPLVLVLSSKGPSSGVEGLLRITARLKETGGLCISQPGLGRVAGILSSCLIEVNIPTRVVHIAS
jgi:hypothetical protein